MGPLHIYGDGKISETPYYTDTKITVIFSKEQDPTLTEDNLGHDEGRAVFVFLKLGNQNFVNLFRDPVFKFYTTSF